MKEEVYDIGGMHCAACSSAVERVTGKLPGIKSSEVNLPMNRLTIIYDETQTTPDMIVAKVEKAGFTAKLKCEDNQEDIVPGAQEDENLKNERNSLLVSVGLAAVLLYISMGQMFFADLPLPDIFSMDAHPMNFALIQILLTIPILIIGRRFFIGGFTSLIGGNPNMDTLVALSSAASFLYSLVMTFLMDQNPHSVHNLYFESAAIVVTLVAVGKYMEAKTNVKTKGAITKLMELAPDTAVIVTEEGQWEVPVSTINVGDVVLVKPGSRAPVDGIVVKGRGNVNEAMLTGESMPVTKEKGSLIIGGSISENAALYVRVTRTGNDTVLSKIIKFVEDAQGKKAPISKIADRVAGVFVPFAIAIATVAAAIWLLNGAEFGFALKIFTCVLVIACPCAMGLATPTAIMVGTGLGASNGILIRSGEALETAHNVTVAVFDKTGTITEGRPVVTDIVAGNEDENAVLIMAASMEKLSDHPLGKAIWIEFHRREPGPEIEITGFENHTGKGLTAITEDGSLISTGNEKLMAELGVSVAEYRREIEELQAQGKMIVFVAKDKLLSGIIVISDKIKPRAREVFDLFRGLDVKTVLLTGDNPGAANSIGQQIGADEIISQVLPTEKAEVIKNYQTRGEVVMMVGDGINDAPALTQADVGCAMGTGTNIAIDSAQIVLMKDELIDVYHSIRLSKLTIRNIKQNLFWAFCYNVLAIPAAAGVLYPAFGILLSPMIGAVAMSLSSLFVVGNALRLRGKRI